MLGCGSAVLRKKRDRWLRFSGKSLRAWESQAVNYGVEQSGQMGGTIRIAHVNVGQFWDPIYVLEPFLDGEFKFPFEYGRDTHGLQFVLVPSRLMFTPLSQSRTNKLFKTDRSILLSFFRCLGLTFVRSEREDND